MGAKKERTGIGPDFADGGCGNPQGQGKSSNRVEHCGRRDRPAPLAARGGAFSLPSGAGTGTKSVFGHQMRFGLGAGLRPE